MYQQSRIANEFVSTPTILSELMKSFWLQKKTHTDFSNTRGANVPRGGRQCIVGISGMADCAIKLAVVAIRSSLALARQEWIM